ncbi:MAG: transketolase, partial [Aminobacterium colombiense]|nr:transketolase [Aminobacterium colombiense]
IVSTINNLLYGEPRTYGSEKKTDNRSAFGNALADVGTLNYKREGSMPLLVFDCDLAGSVKTSDFAKNCPEWFVQTGIQEHATATTAGAASVAGVASLWAGFGVFGLSEVYNQQRLNDINKTNLKLALTHVGLDVGEDGMTHQAIDYVGLMRNMFGWKLLVPADPNQTDRATRWALREAGNVCIAMGRSKLPVITNEGGEPLFAGDYSFEYGKAAKVRDGEDGAIFALGAMTWRALEAWELLRNKGLNFKLFSVATPLEIDQKALEEASATGLILSVEDHHYHNGLGASLALAMAEGNLHGKLVPLGVRSYGASGRSEDVVAAMGLDGASIAAKAEACLKERK